MKKTIQIFILLISLTLSAQISGKYKHEICKYGPNCFVYKFNENGTFEYQYHQDILGSGTLTGNYQKVGDTLKLSPDKVLYASKSKIMESDYQESDSTKIQIILQRVARKGEKDIDSLDWYVSVNDGKYLKTDENGILIIPKTKVNKIQLKDIFQIELNSKPLLKLTDSIFKPKTEKNGIEIYASESDEYTDLLITEWMTRTLLIKGRKLYPLEFEPEVGYLGTEKTYYKKF
ncbi:hypothetical protein [Hwangdonia sp.]|uniref:hypothetical protein n=1 Tax=Hwangdonia sp. TaxID=1883432 RepID=UPI003AB4FDBD